MLLRRRWKIGRLPRFWIWKSVNDRVEEIVRSSSCRLDCWYVVSETFEDDGDNLGSERNQSSRHEFEERGDPVKAYRLYLFVYEEVNESAEIFTNEGKPKSP